MNALPALTIWQPWASLIVIGAKPYEFRSWVPPRAHRGKRIAIHAGARAVKRDEVADLIMRLEGAEAWTTCLDGKLALPLLHRALTSPGSLPRSHIVCTALLGEPVNGGAIAHEFGAPVNDSDRDQHCNWGWPLTDIEPLMPPVAARGAQGLWTWNSSEAA